MVNFWWDVTFQKVHFQVFRELSTSVFKKSDARNGTRDYWALPFRELFSFGQVAQKGKNRFEICTSFAQK